MYEILSHPTTAVPLGYTVTVYTSAMSKAAIMIQKHWRGSMLRKDIKESEKCLITFDNKKKERMMILTQHKLAILWSTYPETIDVIERANHQFNHQALYETLLCAHAFCKLNNRDIDHIEKLSRKLHETVKKNSKRKERIQCES